MFNNLGWGELLVLALIALFIFGPDRLPGVMREAGKTIRQLRGHLSDATRDLRAELGPEMADLDLASLHPKTMLRKHLLDPIDEDDEDYPAATPVGSAGGPPLAEGERPPYDVDAT